MLNRLVSTPLALALWLLFAPVGRCEEPGQTTFSWERYRVVVERNMFLPERSRPSRRPAAEVVLEYHPERYIVLTGVIRDGAEYVAFLEDTRAGVTSRLKVGDSVARGSITDVALGHIAYEYDGRTVEVKVGERLESPSPTGTAAEGPAADEAVGPPASGGGRESESAILERLRQRRRKELGR